jgi:hypothetical protein
VCGLAVFAIGSLAESAELTSGSVNVALLNFTRTTADIGIWAVNVINPGLIETDRFTRNVERVMLDRVVLREDVLRFLLLSHGKARAGQPEETGTLVAYRATAEADFTQGFIISVVRLGLFEVMTLYRQRARPRYSGANWAAAAPGSEGHPRGSRCRRGCQAFCCILAARPRVCGLRVAGGLTPGRSTSTAVAEARYLDNRIRLT